MNALIGTGGLILTVFGMKDNAGNLALLGIGVILMAILFELHDFRVKNKK